MNRSLDIKQAKTKMVMCRFTPDTYSSINQLAKRYKTTRTEVIRALVEKALADTK